MSSKDLAQANRLVAELGPGTLRKKVERRLEESGLRYSLFDGAIDEQIGHQTIASLAHVAPKRVKSTIRAIIDNADVDPWIKGEVDIFFFFDSDDGLIRGYVHAFTRDL